MFKSTATRKKEVRNKMEKELQGITEGFCRLSEDEAYTILWKLTYDENIAEITAMQLGMDDKLVTDRTVQAFRQYLLSHYKKTHPNFMKPGYCKEYGMPFDLDPLIKKIVFEHCFPFLIVPKGEKEEVMEKLNSKDEEEKFSGLRRLAFGDEEARYLLKYSDEICYMMSKICDEDI